MKAGQI